MKNYWRIVRKFNQNQQVNATPDSGFLHNFTAHADVLVDELIEKHSPDCIPQTKRMQLSSCVANQTKNEHNITSSEYP